MPTDTWYRHEMKTVRDMLSTCIGPKWGERPEERVEEIRQSRYQFGKKICRQLAITADDVVADLGSGCGFVTRAACERAGEVHCLDISEDFLDFTRVELREFGNTRFHKIGYASIPLPDGSLDKAFSTAVFIHFNYYDVLFNLIEVSRVLRSGGLFYLDIVDSDVLDLDQVRGIKYHIQIYRDTQRGDARILQPFSLTGLVTLSTRLGFEVVETSHVADVAEVVLRKTTGPGLPGWLDELIENPGSP